jgi:hypothetical protein
MSSSATDDAAHVVFGDFELDHNFAVFVELIDKHLVRRIHQRLRDMLDQTLRIGSRFSQSQIPLHGLTRISNHH